MDFPADGVELSILADVVTQRLHIPIVYDDQIRNKKVVIRVPLKVPESALMGILQSALRMKQMALVDAEQPGWKQIVAAPSLANVATARPARPAGAGGAVEGAVAQVFLLNHADAGHVAEIIRPFLTQPNGYLQADPAKKLLIISDYASVVRRVEELIRSLDADAPPVEVRFIPLKEAEATTLVPTLMQLIGNRETFQWGTGATAGIFLSADERTNQIVAVAPPARLLDLMALVEGMDKAPSLKTKVYRLKSISPERLDRLVRGLIGPALAKRAYQSVIDQESASLAVSATPDIHARMDDLLKELDVPAADGGQSPIHFYKLKNTKAADVLATISGLLGEDRSDSSKNTGSPSDQPTEPGAPATGGASSTNPPPGGSTPSRNPSPFGGSSSSSTSLMGAATPGATTPGAASGGTGASTPSGVSVGNNSDVQYASPALSSSAGSNGSRQGGTAPMAVRGKNATVAADVNTNSIIVIAGPQVQQTYADLIKRLDERRPQVQIECTIVSLDTSDGFTFGVDIGKLGGFGTSQLLTLSSFGISTADPTTGKLAPVAAPGGTFGLLSPRIADIVLPPWPPTRIRAFSRPRNYSSMTTAKENSKASRRNPSPSSSMPAAPSRSPALAAKRPPAPRSPSSRTSARPITCNWPTASN